MFTKTLTTDFLSTVSLKQKMYSIELITYRLPKLRYGKDINGFEKQLLSYLNLKDSKIISLYNGRSAIFQALKLIGIKKNDEVIVSGYTCVSVSNAVIQSGAKIIYSDINKNNLGLDIDSLKSNITEKTKVIIVQHTFGKPSDIKKISKIAKENNILVIEDCAHSLGTKFNGKKLGGFGDFSIFSTGRDKVISSVTGGFLVINNSNYFEGIKKIEEKLKMPGKKLVFKNIMYNILGYKAYKSYDFLKLGRVIIHLSRKFGFITEILTDKEKNCEFKEFNYKLPNSLAFLASKELERIKLYIDYKGLIGEYYDQLISNKDIKKLFKNNNNERLNHYRYVILMKSDKKCQEIYNYMRRNKILLGKTWSNTNIVPESTNTKKAKYKAGSCPNSEDISSRILFLPNHIGITNKDTERVVKLLNNFK